jgi:hypothetical protein
LKSSRLPFEEDEFFSSSWLIALSPNQENEDSLPEEFAMEDLRLDENLGG